MLKQKKYLSLLTLLAVVLCAVTGCKQERIVKIEATDPAFESTVTFQAEILELSQNHALVMPLESEKEHDSSDRIIFSISHLNNIGAVVGALVEIEYNGQIMESYPGQINAISWKLIADPSDLVCYKPVIYLYPETVTDIDIYLALDGELTCTYPKYQNGWHVTARPNGILHDRKGQSFNYLYWEGNIHTNYDFSKGFCVAGQDTAVFLEQALAELGLNRDEANEFIVYWLPLMEQNAYNIITFQQEAYTQAAQLTVQPQPDTIIRVFMTWQASKEFIDIPEQELSAPDRVGFTLVEWGGTQIQ